MKELNTPDLCCEMCAEKIHNALLAAGIKHEINVEGHTVSVEDHTEAIVRAVQILDDLGYEVK